MWCFYIIFLSTKANFLTALSFSNKTENFLFWKIMNDSFQLHHPSRQRKRSVVDAFRDQRRSSGTDSRRRISSDVVNALENEDSWHFDVIELERVTDHHPLSHLGAKVSPLTSNPGYEPVKSLVGILGVWKMELHRRLEMFRGYDSPMVDGHWSKLPKFQFLPQCFPQCGCPSGDLILPHQHKCSRKCAGQSRDGGPHRCHRSRLGSPRTGKRVSDKHSSASRSPLQRPIRARKSSRCFGIPIDPRPKWHQYLRQNVPGRVYPNASIHHRYGTRNGYEPPLWAFD